MLTFSTGAILQFDITFMTIRIILRIPLVATTYLLIALSFKVIIVPLKKSIRSFHIPIKCFLMFHFFSKLSVSIIGPCIVFDTKVPAIFVESSFLSFGRLAIYTLTLLQVILSLIVFPSFTDYKNKRN